MTLINDRALPNDNSEAALMEGNVGNNTRRSHRQRAVRVTVTIACGIVAGTGRGLI